MPDVSHPVLRPVLPGSWSTIRKSGCRFSEKIMLNRMLQSFSAISPSAPSVLRRHQSFSAINPSVPSILQCHAFEFAALELLAGGFGSRLVEAGKARPEQRLVALFADVHGRDGGR